MRSTRRIAVAAALAITMRMMGPAIAQEEPAREGSSQQATPQGSSEQAAPDQGQWAGPMMGPHGMMGYGGGPGFMGPGMMGQGGAWPWMMGRAGSGPAMCNAMAGHIEGRLAYLKAELKITDAQESAWKSYAAAARDAANSMLEHCNAMVSQTGKAALSLPDRLDKHEQAMAAHLEAVRTLDKALKPLYAALSDSQKQTADQLFWGPMGMM